MSLQHVVSYACSEEVPEPVAMGGEGFSVAFDPLDGSSIVDTNFAVGTIFGIWPGDNLVGITGREQVSLACMFLFCVAENLRPWSGNGTGFSNIISLSSISQLLAT